ncbi:aminoacyl-tRNA hydrolase [Candidatus Nomurabacteria bacterium]|nr:aminoacyl-tRNA hydrolase [Candidatus Nomurabacteria bacterium]
MFTIIGLGNPSDEYKNTRHNVAWIIYDNIFSNLNWQKNKYAESELVNTRIDDKDVLLVKPQTFMNESGRVIPYLMKTYGTTVENIIVVHDDIDLPLGVIKISHDRGDGGHNGVKSIMSVLGTKEFTRIRIGVSILDESGIVRKPDVLGNFSQEEQKQLEPISKKIAMIIEEVVKNDLQKAMTKYN